MIFRNVGATEILPEFLCLLCFTKTNKSARARTAQVGQSRKDAKQRAIDAINRSVCGELPEQDHVASRVNLQSHDYIQNYFTEKDSDETIQPM